MKQPSSKVAQLILILVPVVRKERSPERLVNELINLVILVWAF